MTFHPFQLNIETLETINKELETLSSQAASKTIGGRCGTHPGPTTMRIGEEGGYPPSFTMLVGEGGYLIWQ